MLSKFSVVTANALKDIYRAVLLAKLLYASPALWGFATIADKQRIISIRPSRCLAWSVWRC